ncbi:hypothetical protein D3H65_09145 [Paraflavitalea soli]|uniref:Toxin-antitoxin system YwqK family antitoxin n=1 Tax=Paraflavitalea soli TaxID=2315862 RepID=A0A3B7MKF0_9BACT|nr:hypothetical protein [Paraflavitalea soli]AXY74127.1 hypothetical protein D3H65_09145 [Paraflavitalea soli]
MGKSILPIFILLFVQNCSYSQSVSFSLYGYNGCSAKTERIGLYFLKKDSTINTPVDSTGICLLQDTGVYKLSTLFFDEQKTYSFHTFSSYTDTIRIFSIQECSKLHSFSGYCCCGKKCEGYQVDYYSNGQKRIEGTFEEGVPIGSLKLYNTDGSLKSIRKYSKKGKLKKEIVYCDEATRENFENKLYQMHDALTSHNQ